jgi:hypothetical protein
VKNSDLVAFGLYSGPEKVQLFAAQVVLRDLGSARTLKTKKLVKLKVRKLKFLLRNNI